METVNKTHRFLFNTWINHPKNSVAIYRGSSGKVYGRQYGVGMIDIEESYAMILAWEHINRTSGWPLNPDRTIAISQESQDERCRAILN